MRRGFSSSVCQALGGLGWCLVLAGCATTLPPAAPPLPAPAGARLRVENLTDYEWRITVAATGGAEVRATRVPARGSVEVTVAGGDYVIDQAVVAEVARPELARRLPARLEPGQTYRWRLGTLLSDPAGAAGRPGS